MSSVTRWFARLALAAALATAAGYLPYRAYGPSGLGRAARLEREYQQLVETNLRLGDENQRLRLQVERLTDDDQETERVAREELGLVRPGDIVFQLER